MTEKKRRNPKQARAQATVNAVLEAAFQILEQDGEARLTTNLIAERAGVSIGTLYQYFEDREAILAAMGQRQAEATRERITNIILESPETSSMRAIVKAIMSGIAGSPTTRIALSDALFRTRGESVLSEQHAMFFDSLSGRREFGFEMTKETAFVLTHAVICLLRSAAAEPELKLAPDALEDELVLLMDSYLAAKAAQAYPSAG
ncbi:TetR/AcrR family transcriptional regulator [Hyphomonas sp.]|uniref:TetR/AcrR family transcriptional regulator n=1 Tax=Hyphomonas sp. TaxID=87 RepID=UPI0025BDD6D7|nr:TetR/AcrR family transcriptional regulator [Hyphomonas sp.]MBI1398665.1 TetR family transcriptional regulator [Hyphomonas sp.]